MRISATVTISTVYPGTSGGAIFSGRDAAGKHLRFVGHRDRISRAPIIGEVWSLEGEIRSHLGIPMMSISHSDLMPISSERSDAGLSQCEVVIDIRQDFSVVCCPESLGVGPFLFFGADGRSP